MIRSLILSLALLTGTALAQFVTITGTVLSPAGVPYQSGSGRAVLVSGNGSGPQNWTVGGTNPVQTPIVINALDSFGKFSVQLANTSIIDQQSAQPEWQFSFCANPAIQPQVCFTMTPLALASSQDISAQIQGQSAPLPSSAGSALFIKVPGANTIQTTVTSVGATAGVTPVWVEPTHSPSDPGPCPMTNPGGIYAGVGCLNWAQSNTVISDFRVPGYVNWFNPPLTFNNFYFGYVLRSTFTQTNLTGAHQGSQQIDAYYLTGGINICQYGYCHLPWQVAHEIYSVSDTPGNHYGQVIWSKHHAPGDEVALYLDQEDVTSGRNAGGAEGNESISSIVYEATTEFSGTVASISGSQVALTVSQGEGLQGEGLFAVDSSGSGYNTGTITSFTYTNTTTPLQVAFSGATIPASTVNTTLGTAVTAPGSVTVTPGSMAGISNGMYLSIADPKTYEVVKVTGTSGSTFTATFAWPHQTSAIVAGGGLSGGYCFDPHADDATHSTYSEVTGTIHFAIPVIRSTSSSTLDLWYGDGGAGYVSYNGQAPAGGATYDVWPCAVVTSVADPANPALKSDTLTVGPSSGFAPSVGHTVFEAHYFNMWTAGGQHAVGQYLPRPSGSGQPAFFGNYFMNRGQVSSSWRGFWFENDTPAGVAAVVGYPRLFDVAANWGNILFFSQQTPKGWIVNDSIDGASSLLLVQKLTGSGHLAGMYFEPVAGFWRFYDATSNSSTDIKLYPLSGNAEINGKATVATVSTPNLSATGGAASLTQVTSTAGTFGDYGNLVEYSQFDSAQVPPSGGAKWDYDCDHATFTANTGDVTDPLGTNTALKLVTAASGSTCGSPTASGILQAASGLTAGGTYTTSMYARGASGGEVLNFSMENNNPCVNNSWVLTTAWQRVTCTTTNYNGSGNNFQIYLRNQPSTTIYLWGAQLQAGNASGTYIHTTSAQITGSGLYLATGGISPLLYNHSGTVQPSAHLVQDSCVLGTSCAVTLTGASVFTSSTSYTVTCQDDSGIFACNVAQSSGSAFTITGNGTDTIRYIAVGN